MNQHRLLTRSFRKEQWLHVYSTSCERFKLISFVSVLSSSVLIFFCRLEFVIEKKKTRQDYCFFVVKSMKKTPNKRNVAKEIAGISCVQDIRAGEFILKAITEFFKESSTLICSFLACSETMRKWMRRLYVNKISSHQSSSPCDFALRYHLCYNRKLHVKDRKKNCVVIR